MRLPGFVSSWQVCHCSRGSRLNLYETEQPSSCPLLSVSLSSEGHPCSNIKESLPLVSGSGFRRTWPWIFKCVSNRPVSPIQPALMVLCRNKTAQNLPLPPPEFDQGRFYFSTTKGRESRLNLYEKQRKHCSVSLFISQVARQREQPWNKTE